MARILLRRKLVAPAPPPPPPPPVTFKDVPRDAVFWWNEGFWTKKSPRWAQHHRSNSWREFEPDREVQFPPPPKPVED